MREAWLREMGVEHATATGRPAMSVKIPQRSSTTVVSDRSGGTSAV
jgi:hypothetical protein